MSARADLCGGRSAMIVPTATSSTTDHDERFVAGTAHCSVGLAANPASPE